MILKNITQNTFLAHNAIVANSFSQRAFGLIFYKKPQAMIFKTRFGLHTFFMQYPIDILILDKEKKVKAIKKNLQPNRIYLWNPKYDRVIELPSGTIKKKKAQQDDIITVA
jgi:uncharacterized membrane protein (UPF0127 family)